MYHYSYKTPQIFIAHVQSLESKTLVLAIVLESTFQFNLSKNNQVYRQLISVQKTTHTNSFSISLLPSSSSRWYKRYYICQSSVFNGKQSVHGITNLMVSNSNQLLHSIQPPMAFHLHHSLEHKRSSPTSELNPPPWEMWRTDRY